ncbi:MAG: glycine--tRNA ligase subunit beta, partial [Actinoallomurus sp.]
AQPSRRPADGRYGENPNRLFKHTQYQVILKPPPANVLEIYLESLAAIGINLRRHDLKFEEDNWESPTLGAWGLGWQVMLDGLEITQFTYFQQSGGLVLDPVSVEITYGLERIIMALQGVAHFKDIAYAPGLSYGEAFGQAEYEMSRYYLDDADVEAGRALFNAYEAEARRMIEASLPVPAHTYVLKCSHVFNVLDARGAVGTTERATAFARMRTLAHDVAGLWAARRAELGHPLGDATIREVPQRPPRPFPEITEPSTLAFEIGFEELPATETGRVAGAVRDGLTELLEGTRLRHGRLQVMSGPRRVVAVVEDVHPREDDVERTVRGPRRSAAYDEVGAPTKAALGFARGQGADVADLRPVTVNGGEYVGLVQTVTGRTAAEVLADVLPGVVTGLRADRNMRWSAPGLSYSRPIRWITALLGPHVVPFSVATLDSGRTTRVHRTAAEPVIAVAEAGEYVETLRAHGIEPDAAVRRERIVAASSKLAATAGHGGTAGLTATAGGVSDETVLDEVVNLVEEPVAILGSFDERYLDLPAEVLTTVMRKHQRYLHVSAAGRLLPHFVAVANGACDEDVVRAGNEAVLRARFEDAAFFFAADLRTPPEELRNGLAALTFEERLGSMADRAGRIRSIATTLARHAGLDDEERATLDRAARLAKFDLASHMVIELSGLAGTMAGEYARRAGEPDAVAEALVEMERPRSAGDSLPVSLPGALLAVADRLDLLAGLFGVGAAPTGSSDPYGLRRAALGLTAILRAHARLGGIRVDEGLAVAAACQPVEVSPDAVREAGRLAARRLEQALLESGHPVHVVRAVMPHAATPARAAQDAADLERLLETERFGRLTAALQRVLRIVPPGTPATFDPGRFEDDAERALAAALASVGEKTQGRRLPEFATAAEALVEPIDTYFDKVLVMADDPVVRASRLGLLAAIRDLVTGVLDWREVA